jgi:hypothetical protein
MLASGEEHPHLNTRISNRQLETQKCQPFSQASLRCINYLSSQIL